MKTQSALKIFHKMLVSFPTFYTLENTLLKNIDKIIEKKATITNKVYSLAIACKKCLEDKMLTMVDRPAAPIQLISQVTKDEGLTIL